MANSSEKNGTNPKNASSKGRGNKKPKKERKAGTYSIVIGILFIACGIALIIGFIKPEGLIVKSLLAFFRGIIGAGIYLLAAAMPLSGFVLIFSKKKTAVFRAVCIMLLPVFFGTVFHLIKCADVSLGYPGIGELWTTGGMLESGGVICGLIGYALIRLMGILGAWVVTLIFMIVDGVISLSIPLASLTKKPTKKEQAEKEKKREEFREGFREEIVYGDKSDAEPQPKNLKPAQNLQKDAEIRNKIDIPVDEPRRPKKERKFPSLFNKEPNVLRPDEYAADPNAVKISSADIDSAVNDNPVPGFPDDEDVVIAPLDTAISTAEKKTESDADASEKAFESEIAENQSKASGNDYVFPPLSLLSDAPSGQHTDTRDETQLNKQRLESALFSFGINADISNIVRGPSVTRYEMELEVGVKLNKLTSLSEDIALALGVSNVRIAAIPDKVLTVGIEVPNKSVNTVYLREIIDSEEFRKSSSKLTFSIGKNISGEAIVGNIAKLPHLLVAGTTGSGKSVCLNSLILSILYKAKPDEVKFIMIDPKMVEFNVYNGIPHLLVPVVTEAKKASGALQWAVVEMMKRYRLFSETGARDISSYNDLAALSETDNVEPIPQIIVIIDELADLMLVAAKEVEESVCRIAQMGRAAGIHLVIATQSPRADVITGLMKANIPSRISFKVASALESRIILDAGGNADKLLGNGDLLYAPVGISRPARIQGAWVTDAERENIVSFIKGNGKAEYSETIISEIEKAAEDKKAQTSSDNSDASGAGDPDLDIMFPQAVEVVLEMNQASVSMLQRRLKLGYSRAARLVDQMEERGIVGPFEGSKPRPVLITKQQWQEMQYVRGTAPIGENVPSGAAGQTMHSADDLFDNNED